MTFFVTKAQRLAKVAKLVHAKKSPKVKKHLAQKVRGK